MEVIMKKASILLAALLFAAPAWAQGSLYQSWVNCAGDPNAATNINFDCAGGTPASLFATYQLTAPATSVAAVSAVIDVAMNGGSALPPFWHMEGGGCNSAGLGIDDARGAGNCAGANVSFAGSGGNNSDAFVTAYGTPFAGLDSRARILTSVNRASSNPFDFSAGTRYFAFRLDFFFDAATELGGTCAGCTSVVGVSLNTILLESVSAGADAVAAVIQSDDPSSQPSVCVNSPTCTAVPVKARSWGQVKSLYR
jgi:hypothetical protein